MNEDEHGWKFNFQLEEDEKKEDSEDETETEVVDEKFAELEQKFNSLTELNFELSEKIKAFERKDELVQMKCLMEEFAHCYAEGDKEELDAVINTCTYSEFESKVNDKVKLLNKQI